MSRFLEGCFNVGLYSLLMLLLQILAIKEGYKGPFPSIDVQYLADAVIMAGTLASGKD